MQLYESDYVLLSAVAESEKYEMLHESAETRQRIWKLRDEGLLVIHEEFYPNSIRRRAYIRITDAGRDALSEKQRIQNEMLQNVAKQQAEEKRRAADRAEDKRRDFAYFILGLLFGWLLGLITPLDIWNAIRAAASFVESLCH